MEGAISDLTPSILLNNLKYLHTNHDESLKNFLIVYRGYTSHTDARYKIQTYINEIIKKSNTDEYNFNVDIMYVHTSIVDYKSNTEGGKKKKTTRKHRGIIQTGGNSGRLRKGYKYSGQKTKTGLPIIIKTKTKK